jgi:hypothetical protein
MSLGCLDPVQTELYQAGLATSELKDGKIAASIVE